jgi:hypothetical protein
LKAELFFIVVNNDFSVDPNVYMIREARHNHMKQHIAPEYKRYEACFVKFSPRATKLTSVEYRSHKFKK